MKEKLYSILNVDDQSSTLSQLYNYTNIVMTIISLFPLMVHRQSDTLLTIEAVAVIYFIIDYFLRWSTADQHLVDKSSTKAYITYPFTPLAIFDLLAILPFIGLFDQSFRLFRLLRLVRSLRIFRAIRLIQNSKSFSILAQTLQKQKDSLILVMIIVFSYIFIASLLIFNVEPQSFPSFLDAVFWATSSLTTATYGDIYPTSNLGQILSIISYLVGIGVVALPSSLLTAGYIEELEKEKMMNHGDEENHKE